MKRPIWRRITAILALASFVATAFVSVVPQPAAAEPCAMMMGMQTSSDGGDQNSGDTMPPCGSGLSCIVMAALPEVFEPLSSEIVWTPIRYWPGTTALTGLAVPPDYSPPIARV
jgi:hypothetical protein